MTNLEKQAARHEAAVARIAAQDATAQTTAQKVAARKAAHKAAKAAAAPAPVAAQTPAPSSELVVPSAPRGAYVVVAVTGEATMFHPSTKVGKTTPDAALVWHGPKHGAAAFSVAYVRGGLFCAQVPNGTLAEVVAAANFRSTRARWASRYAPADRPQDEAAWRAVLPADPAQAAALEAERKAGRVR